MVNYIKWGLLCASVMMLIEVHSVNRADIDPTVLQSIFGNPPYNSNTNVFGSTWSSSTPVPVSTPAPVPKPAPLVVVFPTQTRDGVPCQCVPYYLCDLSNYTIYDSAQTGEGKLDMRFRDQPTCQQGNEICCKIPTVKTEATTPRPTTTSTWKPTTKIPITGTNTGRLVPTSPLPSVKGCGYRNFGNLDSIIPGNMNEAKFGEFPWVAALLDAADNTTIGAGVLIHPQVVLTVAHVVNKLGSRTMKIKVGESRYNQQRLQPQERLVDIVHIRSDFVGNPLKLENDVALLHLVSPVELTDHINVICLPSQEESFDNYRSCVVNAWRKDFYGHSTTVKKAEQNMVERLSCIQQLRPWLNDDFTLHETIVCAAGTDHILSQGDGGAPLVCPVDNSGRYKLVGLVAMSAGADNRLPGLYSRVSSFRQWIDNVLESWWNLDTSVYKMDGRLSLLLLRNS